MKEKKFRYKILYNGQNIGKEYFTKKECIKEFKEIRSRGLWGYTISKIN